MTLKFGTDGVRGVAGVELTVELTVELARAAVRALGTDEPFLIARDTRRSGPMLEAALVAGICAEGGSARTLGVLPTPGLAGACVVARAPGAMISASHNPYPDNGIKLFEPGGRKLRDETEARIEAELTALLEVGRVPHEGKGIGTAVPVPGATGDYVERIVSAVSPDGLRGLRIVADCGNGAAFAAAPRALEHLGAEVVVLNATPDGTNINDGCGSTDPSGLVRTVLEVSAHAGLAFDGDADRLVAVDERGGLVDGDHILAIAALDLQARGMLRGNAIVTTVMANLGLRRALAANGITMIETPVGDRNVLSAMEEHDLVLGGEQSGHLIFREHAVTGDGPLAGILLLDAVVRAGAPLSQLAAVVTKYPQILRNVRVGRRDGLDAAAGFWTEVRAVQRDLGADGRVLVRPSGTEPVVRVMVEASDETVATTAADRLTAALLTELGSPS
ncbi:MAG TPA: phosphoglucosamine mutase [Acidimicrobiia bacterium]|jgi:phosphoglucosamine mutase